MDEHLPCFSSRSKLAGNKLDMADRLLVITCVLLYASPSNAYQLDQFYSFNDREDQQAARPDEISVVVALNRTFQFNQVIKSHISVSDCLSKIIFCTRNAMLYNKVLQIKSARGPWGRRSTGLGL